jgi:hypothetical protein
MRPRVHSPLALLWTLPIITVHTLFKRFVYLVRPLSDCIGSALSHRPLDPSGSLFLYLDSKQIPPTLILLAEALVVTITNSHYTSTDLIPGMTADGVFGIYRIF